jgi:hypothetical protein
MVAIVEDLLFKQMAALVLGTIFFLSRLIYQRTHRWTSSSEAILIYSSLFAAVLIVLPYLGVRQNRTSIGMILYLAFVLTAVCSVYTKREMGPDNRRISFAIGLLGSAFLLILITRSIQLNGSIYPWAMSGDSRNHLLVVRQIVTDGRVRVLNSYPAFGDAMVGIISGWRLNESSARFGQLAYEIRLLAITIVMYLVGIGYLSSRSVSRGFKRNISFVLVAAGLMSFVMLSQFWLENYLRWGFLSSGLVVLVSIALYNVLTGSETPFGLLIFYVLITVLVVLATFPIMVPAVLGLSVGPVISAMRREKVTFSYKLKLTFGLALPSVVLYLFATHLPFQGFIQNKLNLDGATASMNAQYLIYFVIAFALMIFLGRDSVVKLASCGLTLSLTTLVIDKYLDHALTANYYLDKTRWLSFFMLSIIMFACLVSLFVEAKNGALKVGAASLCAFSTLLFMSPVLQNFSSKNYVKSMVASWEYPTMQEAKTIVGVNADTPRSMFWQSSPNYLSTQIMNMWLMTGLVEIKEKSDIVLWTYNRDQFSLQTICEFALENKPMSIWVQTQDVKSAIELFCKDSKVSIRTLRQGS